MLYNLKWKIRLFYAIQDVLNPNVNSTTNYNTNWIDGNAVAGASTNGTSSAYNPASATNRYGNLGGLMDPVTAVANPSASVKVFIKGQLDSNSSTYLYLRVGIPMWNTDIQFGSVSATFTVYV